MQAGRSIGGITKGDKGTLWLMEMLVILSVAIVSGVYIYIKTNQAVHIK